MRCSLLTLILPLCGCVTVASVNIGTKTSLEKQLMGEIEPLSEEELLAASVRQSGSGAFLPLDEQRARALQARRRQVFNQDDLDELKAQGCAGEGKDAQVVARRCAEADKAEVAARLERLIAEENADRAVIMSWAVATDAALTERDRGQVVQVYRRLLLERARPGDWVQGDGGEWKQK